MKFYWSTLIVKDMDESIKFYEEIVDFRWTEDFQQVQRQKFPFKEMKKQRLN